VLARLFGPSENLIDPCSFPTSATPAPGAVFALPPHIAAVLLSDPSAPPQRLPESCVGVPTLDVNRCRSCSGLFLFPVLFFFRCPRLRPRRPMSMISDRVSSSPPPYFSMPFLVTRFDPPAERTDRYAAESASFLFSTFDVLPAIRVPSCYPAAASHDAPPTSPPFVTGSRPTS